MFFRLELIDFSYYWLIIFSRFSLQASTCEYTHIHIFIDFFSCRYILQRYATLNSACNNLSIWRTTSSSRCVGTISTVIYRRVSMSRFVEAIWWMWRWRQRGNLLRRIVLCCRSVRPIFVKCSLKCQPINMPLVSMRRHHHPPNIYPISINDSNVVLVCFFLQCFLRM